jgi:Concanavalin A-like lectin/glucanases superfamily
MSRSCSLIVLIAACLLAASATPGAVGGFSLRFHGNGVNDIDRVKIPLDPEYPIDVGGTDFTVEWWMKANPGENPAAAITPGGNNWIFGNIIIDRDIYGSGDWGDYGVSLGAGRLAFGVGTSVGGDHTIVGTRVVANGQWHHVAVTRRRADGHMQLFVDGSLDASAFGPQGNASYRTLRPTSFPASDPYFVIGAEKHDAGPSYPSYHGWFDELRVSPMIRYNANFTPPFEPFVRDSNTVALYHFDEGSGDVIADTSGAPFGPSHGVRRFGGSPAGPEWSTDTPWGPLTAPQNFRIIR